MKTKVTTLKKNEILMLNMNAYGANSNDPVSIPLPLRVLSIKGKEVTLKPMTTIMGASSIKIILLKSELVALIASLKGV